MLLCRKLTQSIWQRRFGRLGQQLTGQQRECRLILQNLGKGFEHIHIGEVLGVQNATGTIGFKNVTVRQGTQ